MMTDRKLKFLLKSLGLFLILTLLCYSLLLMRETPLMRSLLSNSGSNSQAFRAYYLSGKSSTSLPLDAIRSIIKKRNQEQYVQNADFNSSSLNKLPNGKLLNEGDPVVVVQVHNRGKYLQGLIHSLSLADGIDRVLLIFSHDVYDDNINSIIAGIKFCKVMQIFYPFSLQLYPNSFPGSDPKDCPRDISVSEAKEVKCLNAAFPDAYGHYREATYTQTKHHWFWKVSLLSDEHFMSFNCHGNNTSYFMLPFLSQTGQLCDQSLVCDVKS